MGYMTIDGRRVQFTDEPNILAVIRKAGIDIPTLCYHSELSVYGACRLCTCEYDNGRATTGTAPPACAPANASCRSWPAASA